MSKERQRKVQMERDAMQREVSAAKRASGLSFNVGWHDSKTHQDWLNQVDLIPQDTRTPAQRLMGEPIFERSALYRRSTPSQDELENMG